MFSYMWITICHVLILILHDEFYLALTVPVIAVSVTFSEILLGSSLFSKHNYEKICVVWTVYYFTVLKGVTILIIRIFLTPSIFHRMYILAGKWMFTLIGTTH